MTVGEMVEDRNVPKGFRRLCAQREAAKTAVGVELMRFIDQAGDTVTFDARTETLEEKCSRIALAVMRALREVEED